MRLVLYGDFNCPFSALASARVMDLEERGIAEVDWRAVQHDTTISSSGELIPECRRRDFERELDQIRNLLVVGEPDRLRLPERRANTRIANEAFAAAPLSLRPAVREELFSAYWAVGGDLSDDRLVDRVAGRLRDSCTADGWQQRWMSLPRPTVPVMVFPDGYVSRGLGALARLALLLDGTHQQATTW